MSNIGPNNYRPPSQQPQSKSATQAGTADALGQSSNPHAANPGTTTNTVAHAALNNVLATGLNQQLALASNQLLQLLKNLLQMPKGMAQLLALLADADPATAQAMLQSLLASETPVPLEQLQQLLLSHADAAQDKLMKLLQTTAMSPAGQSPQMGELLNTLNDLLSKAKESPTQALQSTIGLYLPHFPLHPPQGFSLRYEQPESGDGEKSGESQSAEQLALFIDTVTLGQFKITLAAQGRTPIQAVVQHDPDATPYLTELTGQVDSAMGGSGRLELLFLEKPARSHVPSPPSLSEVIEDGVQPDSRETTKQSVALHPSGGITLAALHGAYAIIRVVFEMDDDNQLSQTRLAMV